LIGLITDFFGRNFVVVLVRGFERNYTVFERERRSSLDKNSRYNSIGENQQDVDCVSERIEKSFIF
jgi:hypothetical protein